MEDMLEDVNAGIRWVLASAARHGGDAGRAFLVGQSAGAQLGAMALIAQVGGRR
jgi:acetyl esterase/lipase